MPIEPATADWSDAITITGDSLLQSRRGRIAVSVGSGAPPSTETGSILPPGQMVFIAATDIRIRAVDAGAELHYQAWPY